MDDQAIRMFASSGMKKDIIMPTEDINRVCHIRHVDSYVGWKYKDSKLYVSTYSSKQQSWVHSTRCVGMDCRVCSAHE